MSSVYYKKLLNYNLAYYEDNTPMVSGNTQFYTVTGLHWGNSPLYSNVYNTTYEKVWEISDRLSFTITVSYRSGYYHCVGSVTFDEHTTSIKFDNGLNTKQRDFGIIIDDDISEAWCYFVGDNSRSDQTTTSVQAFTCMPYDKQAFYSYIKSLIIIISNGGGATHIAKVTGQLKDLSSNLSDILIVSGGGGGGVIAPTGSNVFQGYKINHDTELHWDTYEEVVVELPNNLTSNKCRAYIAIIHRQPILVPNDWSLLDIRDNRCDWHQYVSIYDKVISQSETVRITQYERDAMAVMTFYTEVYNTIEYDDEYYPFSYDSNSTSWNIEQKNYKRIFVFNEGYYTSGTSQEINYSPSLNGWKIPTVFSTSTVIRAFLFYMDEQSSYSTGTILTYDGLRIQGSDYAQDMLDASQICVYKIIETNIREGADAGGIAGNNRRSANQTHGYAFGEGESATDDSAGGGGFYGGYKDIIGGGAGSGYIGNLLLSNKKMVGYNVPTSSAEGTKTESVNEVSAIPVSDKPKAGNGHARIKFLRAPEPSSKVFFEANFNADGRDKVNYGNNDVTMITYDGDYEYITRTAKQGELINFFESCAWSVANGELNISLATLINPNTPLFIWGYDTDVVNQQFFPQDCIVTVEMEVFFETATSYIFFDTYDDYGDGELYSQGADFTLDVSELTTQAWHNIQVKFDTSMNYDSCYVDNEQVDIVDGYGGTFPCVIDDEDLVKCHAIGLRISEVDSPVLKIRKFKVYYT